MEDTLRPCTTCNRHVRVGDVRCPFCEPMSHGSVVTRPGTVVALALGASVALGVLAAPLDVHANPQPSDPRTMAPAYGGPPPHLFDPPHPTPPPPPPAPPQHTPDTTPSMHGHHGRPAQRHDHHR